MLNADFYVFAMFCLVALSMLIALFAPAISGALTSWGAARVQNAEARRLEAQNEADRLRLALAEQEKG